MRITHPDTSRVVTLLAAEQARFRGFLVKRLGNEADAEDLLQQNLLALLRRGAGPRDEERTVPWFYRVLRRALVDRVRSETARRRREESWSEETARNRPDPDLHRIACGCVAGVIAALPAGPAELLRRVDLQDEPIAAVAADLRVTVNAATVRLHRARRALRAKLEEFCGACAGEHCRDCGCPPPAHG